MARVRQSLMIAATSGFRAQDPGTSSRSSKIRKWICGARMNDGVRLGLVLFFEYFQVLWHPNRRNLRLSFLASSGAADFPLAIPLWSSFGVKGYSGWPRGACACLVGARRGGFNGPCAGADRRPRGAAPRPGADCAEGEQLGELPWERDHAEVGQWGFTTFAGRCDCTGVEA